MRDDFSIDKFLKQASQSYVARGIWLKIAAVFTVTMARDPLQPGEI